MRVRLRTKTPTDKPARVDRTGNGKILGASLICSGEALGHGFHIDGVTLDQVAKLASEAGGRWTHGNLCADGLGSHLGRWKNVRREGESVLGDFHFSPLAKNVQPEGLSVDAPTYLMDAAENEPDVVGVSCVLDIEGFEEAPTVEGQEPRRLARVAKVPRADYVADPAANPDGLFAGTPSELSDRATFALGEAESIYGRERVVAFLRAHLGQNPPEVSVTIEELKKAHAEELAARDARLAKFEADLAARDKADSERLAREDAAYVEGLKAKSAEAQSPIDAAKLAKVEAHLKAGRREFARELGDELLSAALSKRSTAFSLTATKTTATTDIEEGSKRGVSRLRARAGLKTKAKE
jgi:Skp family chaperone for outer membrane proteins